MPTFKGLGTALGQCTVKVSRIYIYIYIQMYICWPCVYNLQNLVFSQIGAIFYIPCEGYGATALLRKWSRVGGPGLGFLVCSSTGTAISCFFGIALYKTQRGFLLSQEPEEPNNRALVPKYYNINGIWALKPYHVEKGPSRLPSRVCSS